VGAAQPLQQESAGGCEKGSARVPQVPPWPALSDRISRPEKRMNDGILKPQDVAN
jgi:hypothetical protein